MTLPILGNNDNNPKKTLRKHNVLISKAVGIEIFIHVSHQAGFDTRSSSLVEIREAETRALLDNAGHRITWCNGNYVSLCQVS